jgi:hypothetical protein
MWSIGAYMPSSVDIGAYQFNGAAGGAPWMDGSMTEAEWWNWRRRMFRQQRGWRNV